jgi:hypothetical protein
VLIHLTDQACHANHEKLVEIVRRYGEEAQAFQQRVTRVVGLFEHPSVEAEPGQFAIDEALRRGHQMVVDRRVVIRAQTVL